MNWIQSRRKKLNLSQDDLARNLQLAGYSVTRASVSHWENGRYLPPLEDEKFRMAISTALQMSESEMLTLAGYAIHNDDDTDAVRAAIIISRLPKSVRNHVMEYLDMLQRQHVKTG